MADLSSLLLASLHPSTRKQAEQQLETLSLQPGFPAHILQLVLNPGADRGARLAASVYFKNIIRKRWSDETDDNPISPADKQALRPQIVPAMIALSSTADKGLRAQIAESVTVIAKSDFPENWPTLIDELVSSLSQTDYSVNLGVLETAHSIFVRWRSSTRSNQLFADINYVLSRFMEPYLAMFRQTATLLLQPQNAQTLATLAQTQIVLVTLFYDLTCQDLPPALEDAHLEFFGPGTGWFVRFLAFDPPELAGDPDDATPSLPSQLKTNVLEVAELYANLFSETLAENGVIQNFVQAVWELIGSGKRTGVADDQLVSQALRLLATLVRQGSFAGMFESDDVIKSLVESVAVPNVALRDHETEQFEDDPLEYIRLDMSLGDTTTRRTAAAELLRALVSSSKEATVTSVVGAWIGASLQRYSTNQTDNWKDKDAAIYVLTAVASKGATSLHGVTSTSMLIDVVQFFGQHIAQDLQAAPGSVHPILQVDAIRFLNTFRSQLTKDQLLQVLPLLMRHLLSEHYVCFTYAAIAIERILFIKKSGSTVEPLFTPTDVQDSAGGILDALFSRIERGGSPQKVAENDYLMKCVLRVIITTGSAIVPVYERILNRLIAILRVIMQNPSNPIFSQYTFESISALIRLVTAAKPEKVSAFETALLPSIEVILQQDIDQFVQYAFQILSQLLEQHAEGTPPPPAYDAVVASLMQPQWWAQRGSIPPLVRLLRAYLMRAGANVPVQGVLGVLQQRLIPSKINDEHGFDLLQGLVQYAPVAAWGQYFRGVLVTLLTRLQTSKTDRFVYYLVYFFSFILAIQRPELTPDFLIRALDEIQPGLFGTLLSTFVIEQIPKFVARDRKVVIVGIARLLTQSDRMVSDPALTNFWPATAAAVLTLALKQPAATDVAAPPMGLEAVGATEIDIEEANAGYQAAYARLAASEVARADPAAAVPDENAFLKSSLASAPPQLLQRLDPSLRAALA
ncbi:importin alpha re-exporter [Exidia glandulosa HHB12029]|uniref:Importin alpha re-exporter n=1 Tax=Exidia glandulosa HHB12029 TaxID=1314781 RepID=A0A166AM23_EXIGL|nr:importin alpha re-exporter [Exidia glandulosa HHB12029]